MILIVIRPGTYNDAQGRSRKYQAEDRLETSLDYGQGLIVSGYARSVEAAQPAPQGKLKTRRRK